MRKQKKRKTKMKKLLVMLGIAAIAVSSQAASVVWTITSVTGPTGSALGTGRAYVFFVESTTKLDTSTFAAAWEGKGATEVQNAMGGAAFDYTHAELNAGTAAGTWSYNATTASAVNQTTLGLAGNTKYSVYAVIFDTEAITDASKFYVTTASAAAQTYDNSAGTTRTFGIGAQTASATSSNWHSVSVPEPTSGLLMLVGLGALALRRRRA